MNRLYILFVARLLKASFSKVSGAGFIEHQFPFSKLMFIWPTYLWLSTFYLAFIAIAWSAYFQETKYRIPFLIFCVLQSGELVDYMIRGNYRFFHINLHIASYSLDYPFSYDSFFFLIFGAVVILEQIKNARI